MPGLRTTALVFSCFTVGIFKISRRIFNKLKTSEAGMQNLVGFNRVGRPKRSILNERMQILKDSTHN